MKLSEISFRRLQNQQLLNPEFQKPVDLLHWMGAMQAQDYEMVKWALGVRLRGSTISEIEHAIENGQIIRTHLLRPTWHFVAAKDIRWILSLAAPRIKVAIRSRSKQLGLTEKLISKSNSTIERALDRRDYITRKELAEELKKSGFKNEDNRISHLLIHAELDEVICSGPSFGKDYTYSLFNKRIPPSTNINRDEALSKLAKTYFQSHGPATIDDFIWWSGLTKTGAKKALGFVEEELISKEIDSQTYWFLDSNDFSIQPDESVHLLPAYDELLISYKDRTPSIRFEEQKKVISNNGIFRPVIVIDGEVVGIWKRSVQKKTVFIETQFFTAPTSTKLKKVEEAARNFSDFLEKELIIDHVLSR